MKDTIDEILATIDEAGAIAFLREVVAIDSIWGREKALAEFLAGRCREWGLGDVQLIEGRPDRPTIAARVAGTGAGGGRSLIFNGHIDIYELSQDWTLDPWQGAVKDGRVYGAGIADEKSGTAALFYAAGILARSGVRLAGDLWVEGVPAHFEGGVGTRAARDAGILADAAITCEASEMKLAVAHRGAAYLKITTIGRQAHTTAKGMGINAIEKMMRVIEGLNHLALAYEPHPLLTGGPILNVGTIQGGTKHNQVPDRCQITIDLRILPSQTPEGVKAEVEAMIARLRDADPQLNATVEFSEYWLSGPRYPTETPLDAPIARAAQAALRRGTGREPEVVGLPFWADMAVFKQYGIPAVNIGPGGPPYNFADEYVTVAEYLEAVRTHVALAIEWCGVAG